MNPHEARRLGRNWGVSGLGTLLCRLLGMLRDMGLAALLGAGQQGVMDAFSLALRLANLVRAVWGEGALASSYVPFLAAAWQRGNRAGWSLVSAVLAALSVVLALVVAAGELLCALLWWRCDSGSAAELLCRLLMILLPSAWFACVAAQQAATLQSLGRFRLAALAPGMLSLGVLAACGLLWQARGLELAAQVQWIAAAVTLSGLGQWLLLTLQLRRLGYRLTGWSPADWPIVRQVAARLLPTAGSLALARLSGLADTLVAWGLSTTAALAWVRLVTGQEQLPLPPGTAASLYYCERLYQLPVGLLGVTLAAVCFPRFSRLVAQRQERHLPHELARSLAWLWWWALPASLGLALVAQPLVAALFERGQFTSADTARTARLLIGYALGIGCTCSLPVVLRVYYSLDDRRTPLFSGAAALAINLGLNLLLIWPCGELGLALATSLASAVQLAWLLGGLSRRCGGLPWPYLGQSLLRALAATAVVGLAATLARQFSPDQASSWRQLAPCVLSGLAAFAPCCWWHWRLRPQTAATR